MPRLVLSRFEFVKKDYFSTRDLNIVKANISLLVQHSRYFRHIRDSGTTTLTLEEPIGALDLWFARAHDGDITISMQFSDIESVWLKIDSGTTIFRGVRFVSGARSGTVYMSAAEREPRMQSINEISLSYSSSTCPDYDGLELCEQMRAQMGKLCRSG